jgi:hypothetical protein
MGCVLWGGGTLAGGGVKRPGFRARDSLSLAQNKRDGLCWNGAPVTPGVCTTRAPPINPLPRYAQPGLRIT